MSTLNRQFLGLRIKHLRKTKGLKTSFLAKHLDVSPTTYYNLEKGLVNNCAHLYKKLFILYGQKVQ